MTCGGANGTPDFAFASRPPAGPPAPAAPCTQEGDDDDSDTMPTRSPRKPLPRLHPDAGRLGQRPGTATAFAAPRRARRRSFEHHPRIDELVEHVGDEVDHHREHGQVDRSSPGSPGSRCGPPRCSTSRPRPGMEKNTSIRNEPMKTPGSCVADVGQDRDHRVAQHVLEQDACSRSRPWRARCARSRGRSRRGRSCGTGACAAPGSPAPPAAPAAAHRRRGWSRRCRSSPAPGTSRGWKREQVLADDHVDQEADRQRDRGDDHHARSVRLPRT